MELRCGTIITLITLTAMLERATALTCYMCVNGTNYDTDVNCSSTAFDKDSSSVNREICSDEDNYCIKIVYSTSNKTYRGCSAYEVDGEEVCDYWLDHGASSCSICDDDLCNTGSLPSSPAALLWVLVLVGLLAAERCASPNQ